MICDLFKKNPSNIKTVTSDEDKFQKCMEFVFKWEGGLVNHPSDPGGLTNFGISKRAYPHLTDEQIINMTKETAMALYRIDYWEPNGFDYIEWPLCLVGFDTCVNSGATRWKFFLDKARTLNPTKKQSKEIANLVIDLRREYYNDLGKKDKYKHFLKGWLNRLKDLEIVANGTIIT